MFTLHNGDCLQIMPTLPAGSVDAIITDLPYGTTACAWDEVIEFAPMWEQVKRVLKPSGVFITTSAQPFTSFLVVSNPTWYKHEVIWNKKATTNFYNADFQPLRIHENVIVFGSGEITYNPQKEKLSGSDYRVRANGKRRKNSSGSVYGDIRGVYTAESCQRHPKSIVEYPKSNNSSEFGYHPTQKPVSLYRYLIRTYTNEGEIVLDIAMGSGTTIEAAIIEGRYSIGIERDPKYFAIAEKRIKQAALQPSLFTPSNNRLHLTGGESGQQNLFSADDVLPAKLPVKSPRR